MEAVIKFFEAYGAQITAMLVALGSLAGSIYGIIKTIKMGKKVDTNAAKTQEDIQVTREGIVEAFKSAKIPTEWKISVSNQVTKTLTDFRDELIDLYKKNNEVRDKLMLATLKILSFTAASNKLTDEEKNQINDLIKQISDEDSTIDITE